MYCSNCGSEIAEKAIYCHVCREKVERTPAIKEDGQEDKSEKRENDDKKKRIVNGYKYFYLLMFISQVIGIISVFYDIDWISNGVNGLCIAAYVLDLQYLKALGLKGYWKLWGLLCTPVYLFIRANKLKQKPTVAIMSTVLVIVSLFFAFTPENAAIIEEDPDYRYVICAKTLVNDTLKNPSSVIYNDAYVYEKDDYGRAIVYLDYSAQNGFGGYVREQKYVFINRLNKDGTFNYNPSFYYCNVNGEKYDYMAFDLKKKKNNFGVADNK